MGEEPGPFSATHHRPRLLRRLATLRTLEWFNAVWIPTVMLWLLPSGGFDIRSMWQRTLALGPLVVLLVLGGWYWHVKLAQLRDGRPPDSALGVLARLDGVLRAMLAAATCMVAAAWVSGMGTWQDRAWASGFVVFAWLEYVNYFRSQLMHDTGSDLRRLLRTRRLRPSWLASDLDGRQTSERRQRARGERGRLRSPRT